MVEKTKKLNAWLSKHEFILIILLLVVVLRIPNLFEPYWYGDEGIYLAVGHGLRSGLKLYAEIIDHKTPIIYWITWLVRSLLGLKLVLVLASLASILLFYLIVKKLIENKWAVMVSTIVFAALTTLPWLEGNIANGEILLMPMVLFGVWKFWNIFSRKIKTEAKLVAIYKKSKWWQPLVIGSCFALAVLLKVPSGFDLAAMGLFFALYIPFQWKKKNVGLMFGFGLLMLTGFLITIALSIGWFALQGTLQSYFDFGLLYNFRYIQIWGSPFTNPVLIFLASMTGRLAILGLFLGGVFGLRKKIGLPLTFTLVWFGLTLFAALLSLRPYPHYFIQVVPAIALMAGFLVTEKWTVKAWLLTLFTLVFLILLKLEFKPYPTAEYYKNFLSYATRENSEDDYILWFDAKTKQIYDVANWLKQRTSRYERIFIWGDEAMVYALSERVPVGRFTVAFHIDSFNAFDETMKALSETMPKYVIIYRNHNWRFDELKDYVSQNYILVETIESAEIYRHFEYN